MPSVNYYSGAWVPVKKIYYWSGAWIPVQNAYYWSGGWVKFFAATQIALSNGGASQFATAPTDAYAGYRIHADGTIDTTEAGSLSWNINAGTWLLNGSSSEFEVMASGLVGDTPSGSAMNTWINCSTSPFWYQVVTGTFAQRQCSFTLQMREASTHNVLETVTIFLDAEVESGA